MIINSQNKDSILKGTTKRGFNQTPRELKEKLYDMRSNTIKTRTISEETQSKEDYLKLKNTHNNLNRLNKKI